VLQLLPFGALRPGSRTGFVSFMPHPSFSAARTPFPTIEQKQAALGYLHELGRARHDGRRRRLPGAGEPVHALAELVSTTARPVAKFVEGLPARVRMASFRCRWRSSNLATSEAVIARLDRAIQYSREASDRADKPRSTGSPGQPGDDRCARGDAPPSLHSSCGSRLNASRNRTGSPSDGVRDFACHITRFAAPRCRRQPVTRTPS